MLANKSEGNKDVTSKAEILKMAVPLLSFKYGDWHSLLNYFNNSTEPWIQIAIFHP